MRDARSRFAVDFLPSVALTRHIKMFFALLLFAWTAAAAALITLAYHSGAKDAEHHARIQAETVLLKDSLYRRWAAGHGGVYVPMTLGTPANESLGGLPERDITTPSGRRLTLMNPEYMMRQVFEFAAKAGAGTFARLTSLRLVHPGNAPDTWEAKALRIFERGAPEIVEVANKGAEPELRLMRPLFVEETCLPCHGSHGYRIGEIRGGISVSVPLGPHLEIARKGTSRQVVIIAAVWALGALTILLSARVFCRQVATQRRTEDALRDSEERYRLLFEAESDAIVLIDNETGRILEANSAAAALYGFAHDELLAMRNSDLSAEPEETQRVTRENVPDFDRVVTIPLRRHRKKDGSVFPVEITGRFFLRGGRPVHIAAIRDITERLRAEESLWKYSDALARSNRELDQFAHLVSHDLQEPLRMIASYTELLGRDYGDHLDERGREFAGFIMQGAGRMQQLIESLLTYSRLTTRAQPFAPVALDEPLREALEDLALPIQEHGARIVADPLPTVFGDRVLLRQLFQNLVGNAIKFSTPGTPPRIEIGARKEEAGGGMWVVSIRDHGIGIDPKHFDRIFVIFQRLQTEKEYPGAGVGLAVCKKIVERHGGRIWVESEPGRGATFFFNLPAPP